MRPCLSRTAATVGHWSTAPISIYQVLLSIFGLHTYLPYMVVLVIVHLVATHLIWRIALRVGTNPWIVTAAVAGFAVFGTGAENLLWAFQIGFIGALAVGLGAFLLALSTRPSLGVGSLAIVALVLFSLIWSGTAIPLVVATAALIFVRHGWRKALTVAVVAGGIYLAWYFAFAEQAVGGVDPGQMGFAKLAAMVKFIGVMLFFGFGDVFPAPGLGFAILLGIVAWIVVMLARRVRLPGAAPTFVLLGAAALFAFMTAYSRAVMSAPSGRSSRYIYLVTLLLIPLLTLALTRAVERLAPGRRSGTIVAVSALLALTGYQVFLLVTAAAAQSERELPTERLFSAALDLYREGAPDVHLDSWPDPIWAPDIRMYELVDIYDAGWIDIGPYTTEDEELAKFYLAR